MVRKTLIIINLYPSFFLEANIVSYVKNLPLVMADPHLHVQLLYENPPQQLVILTQLPLELWVKGIMLMNLCLRLPNQNHVLIRRGKRSKLNTSNPDNKPSEDPQWTPISKVLTILQRRTKQMRQLPHLLFRLVSIMIILLGQQPQPAHRLDTLEQHLQQNNRKVKSEKSCKLVRVSLRGTGRQVMRTRHHLERLPRAMEQPPNSHQEEPARINLAHLSLESHLLQGKPGQHPQDPQPQALWGIQIVCHHVDPVIRGLYL